MMVIMFKLPCSCITTFLMEIPNNINTSRLYNICLDGSKVEKVIKQLE